MAPTLTTFAAPTEGAVAPGTPFGRLDHAL
jgi:hypothetical protein